MLLSLLEAEQPIEWRLVAKDGADLPRDQATLRPARLLLAPGEIYDFELTPRAPGWLRLRFNSRKLRFSPEDEPVVVAVQVR